MDFDLTQYSEMRNSLLELGIKCDINSRHQVTVSAQDSAIWPDQGNSFWITCATGGWHLFTWSPIGYRVPTNVDLIELCRRCMSVGESAMHSVPKEIVEDFGLIKLDDSSSEIVYSAMKTAD